MAIDKDHAATDGIMQTSQQTFDLDYRPDTYWPVSRSREQLLSRIKGQVRRQMAADALASGGVEALNVFLARESLPDAERRAWGQQHPWFMGGEYLPDLAASEVEIARLSLASVTHDQISIRARAAKNHIRIFVTDEHEMKYQPSHRRVQRPLSLRELIAFIETTNNAWADRALGMVWNLIRATYDEGCFDSPREAGEFVTVESAIYPELGPYYAHQVAQWVAREEARYEAEDAEGDEDTAQ